MCYMRAVNLSVNVLVLISLSQKLADHRMVIIRTGPEHFQQLKIL